MFHRLFLFSFLGYAPCALLCRAVGEKLYVSFAERLPDGLTCEAIATDAGDPGDEIVSVSEGVCLNGTCQVRCTSTRLVLYE
jgi:hypothetical protein